MQAGNCDAGRCVPGDVHHVVGALRSFDGDGVGRAVAHAGGRGEVEVDLRHVGSRQVVDGDCVGAAEGVEVDALDAGGVHGDVGDVAGEPEAVAVRRQVDLLGDVGAVEEQRVGAVLALDDVATVTRIPDEGVVVGTQERDVVAAVPVDRVVPVAAEQCLRTGAAGEIVVSVPAVDRRRDRVGEDAVALVDAHLVVTRPGVDADLRDAVAFEAEVGRPVVTDVDLESARVAGLQAKRDLVTLVASLDRQHPVLELRVLELGLAGGIRGLVGGRGIALSGHDPSRAGEGEGHGHGRNRQPHGPHAAPFFDSNELLHQCTSPSG